MSQQPSTNNYQLKVCGLTKINQIQELISLNVDFLGFIFYEKSPRFVLNHLSLEEISEINHQGKVAGYRIHLFPQCFCTTDFSTGNS